ncbi:DUF6390 family protein [Rhabdothermincola sp.]|uniref:DUF6390 family protein n=1 Tax=Rhabdothermincola sp. TaxID=2820405 RepID=UPI002FE123D2
MTFTPRRSGPGAEGEDGALLFARFAYPPNELGYCGPDDDGSLLEYVASGATDGGLRQLCRGFEGAWPYLEVIAGASGLDPLDRRVVEAYWLGSPLLDRVAMHDLGGSVEDRFRGRAGADWDRLVAAIDPRARLSHAFHVFAVYPWVGLLRGGTVEQPLHVLDRCRIRWGIVERVDGDLAVVRCRPLAWDGMRLTLGPPTREEVVGARGGLALAGPVREGDVVALHWGWICLTLDPRRLSHLKHYHQLQLDLVNQTGVAARLS